MKKLLVMILMMVLLVPCLSMAQDSAEQSVLVRPPQAYAMVPGLIAVPIKIKPRCCPQQKGACQQTPKPNFKTPIRDCMWKHKQCMKKAIYNSRVKRYNRLGQLITPQIIVVPVTTQ